MVGRRRDLKTTTLQRCHDVMCLMGVVVALVHCRHGAEAATGGVL